MKPLGRTPHQFVIMNISYLKLILSDPVESKIFVVDGIKSAAENAGLDFVILIR